MFYHFEKFCGFTFLILGLFTPFRGVRDDFRARKNGKSPQNRVKGLKSKKCNHRFFLNNKTQLLTKFQPPSSKNLGGVVFLVVLRYEHFCKKILSFFYYNPRRGFFLIFYLYDIFTICKKQQQCPNYT